MVPTLTSNTVTVPEERVDCDDMLDDDSGLLTLPVKGAKRMISGGFEPPTAAVLRLRSTPELRNLDV